MCVLLDFNLRNDKQIDRYQTNTSQIKVFVTEHESDMVE